MYLTKVRVGFIGVGIRGLLALRRFCHIHNVDIIAVCDVDSNNIEKAESLLAEKNIRNVALYQSKDSWKDICSRTDIDLLYISTPWEYHATMALFGIECGKNVAVEVPLAMTVDDCWRLVRAAEKHAKQCIMLENCCFDQFTQRVINMVNDGVFGTLYHAEGAYIHRLCERVFGCDTQTSWMPRYYMQHTGNPYPTHAIGPLALMMNINRGDKLDYLVSVSSSSNVLSEYVKEHHNIDACFSLGDVNTTIIKTINGATITLQHDISTPRPYSRGQLICGTKGVCQKFPFEAIALHPNYETFLCEDDFKELLLKYREPVVDEIVSYFENIEDAILHQKSSMDFVMDRRLIDSLTGGRKFDIDVYDGALWSSIIELSEKSALSLGKVVNIPDFKNGQ